jgi:NAD(P)-dependent dehydrogenase (short-subunit alcohol dehydrogenase family)
VRKFPLGRRSGMVKHGGPDEPPETIEQTAELAAARGGTAIAMRVDHLRPAEVAELFQRIGQEQAGRLDVLVNDIWGGDPLTQWGAPFWRHSLADGLQCSSSPSPRICSPAGMACR